VDAEGEPEICAAGPDLRLGDTGAGADLTHQEPECCGRVGVIKEEPDVPAVVWPGIEYEPIGDASNCLSRPHNAPDGVFAALVNVACCGVCDVIGAHGCGQRDVAGDVGDDIGVADRPFRTDVFGLIARLGHAGVMCRTVPEERVPQRGHEGITGHWCACAGLRQTWAQRESPDGG
jgi:hypothetical protein